MGAWWSRSPGRCFLGLLLGLSACSGEPLELRGALHRVVGEIVSLELVEGEGSFSGDLTLEDAEGTRYQREALSASSLSARTVAFVVPMGIAQGEATLGVGRQDGAPAYAVPLGINRFVLALNQLNVLSALPLAPATLPANALTLGDGRPMMALMPGGGVMLIYAGDLLRPHALGAKILPFNAAVQLPGAVGLAALPGGALVATDASLTLVRFVGGEARQTSVPLVGARVLASSADGTRAAVLAACDGEGDVQPEECVVPIRIEGDLPVLESPISLDGTPDAELLRLTGDGRGLVVVDRTAVHGVWLGSSPPLVSRVEWAASGPPPSVEPVGIERSVAAVSGLTVDIFALAEKMAGEVRIVAFNPELGHLLQQTAQIPLMGSPAAIAFGRGTDLFVALESTIRVLDASQPQPEIADTGLSLPQPVRQLLVQP